MADYRSYILVCCGTGCTSSGSHKILEKLNEIISAKGLSNEVKVSKTSSAKTFI